MSLRDFTESYIDTALWSSKEEGDDVMLLDKSMQRSDISEETLRQMELDCAAFYGEFEPMWTGHCTKRGVDEDEMAGEDFWLSRNGHGRGFFAGNYWDDEVADDLQAAAKRFGAFDLYVGDDGQVWGSPLSDAANATAMAGFGAGQRGAKTNAEGLTWAEWSAAAGTKSAEAKRAWEAGEDPSEWRAGLGGDMDVANTILQQMGGTGRLAAMIGAKNFVALPDGVQFSFAGKAATTRSNKLVVKLLPSDTYRMEFWWIRGAKFELVREIDDVYADQLVDLFQRETGLYLSMGTMRGVGDTSLHDSDGFGGTSEVSRRGGVAGLGEGLAQGLGLWSPKR